MPCNVWPTVWHENICIWVLAELIPASIKTWRRSPLSQHPLIPPLRPSLAAYLDLLVPFPFLPHIVQFCETIALTIRPVNALSTRVASRPPLCL